MSRVKFHTALSIDGYMAGAHQSLEHPTGEGGTALHEWIFETKFFHEMTGEPGGESGVDDRQARYWLQNVGATIMGRNMFGPVRGPWPDDSWKGWWGANPPYHAPVFVLTHHARAPIAMEGGTTFHFVTEGAEAALARARAAAGSADILLAGGASAAQQFLRAGLVDEMGIHLVPVLLGGGERLFENLGGGPADLRCVETLPSKGVTHYRFLREGAAG